VGEPQISYSTWKLTYIQYYIVLCSCNQCCHGNEKISSLSIVAGIHPAVNNIKVFIVAMEMQQWIPLHCCQSTKYFILQVTMTSMKHYVRVSVFLPVSLHANHIFCALYSGVLCGVSGRTIFFYITSQPAWFQDMHVLMFSTTFVWNISHSTTNSGVKEAVCGLRGSYPAGVCVCERACVPLKPEKRHLFLPSPIHASPQHNPWKRLWTAKSCKGETLVPDAIIGTNQLREITWQKILGPPR
jgi:hypothetical protein